MAELHYSYVNTIVTAAFQHVRDNIDELDGKNGINEMDLIFLKSLMDTPVMQSLVKVIN